MAEEPRPATDRLRLALQEFCDLPDRPTAEALLATLVLLGHPQAPGADETPRPYPLSPLGGRPELVFLPSHQRRPRGDPQCRPGRQGARGYRTTQNLITVFGVARKQRSRCRHQLERVVEIWYEHLAD